jgi:hypothetical protein
MKRIFLPFILILGLAIVLSACAPAVPQTPDQPAMTQAAQTIQALMTQVVKQSTPFIPPTNTVTQTPFPTDLPAPTLTEALTTPPAPGTTPAATKSIPSITRTLSGNCLNSFLVGVIGSKWDADRKAWVLEETANAPFTATFDVRNIGTCTWDPAFLLVYYTGEHMSGPNAVTIGSTVDPNDPKFNHVNIDVGPLMIGGKGYHTGYWAMKSSDGRVFGSSFLLTVLIK